MGLIQWSDIHINVIWLEYKIETLLFGCLWKCNSAFYISPILSIIKDIDHD